MKRNIIKIIFIFVATYSSVYTQENKFGTGVFLRLANSDNDEGAGINLFYERALSKHLSLNPYIQASFSTSKYIKSFVTYGIDFHYLIDKYYLGCGVSYDKIYGDLKGNASTIDLSYSNSFGYNILGGVYFPISKLHFINLEIKYNILRPESTIKYRTMTNTQEIIKSKGNLDNLSLRLSFCIIF